MNARQRDQVVTALSVLAHSADRDLAALSELAAVRDTLEEYVKTSVASHRNSGATWQQIGAAFGTTRSAAQQRYAATENTNRGAAPR